jgi:PAS domain S-box-containing protein
MLSSLLKYGYCTLLSKVGVFLLCLLLSVSPLLGKNADAKPHHSVGVMWVGESGRATRVFQGFAETIAIENSGVYLDVRPALPNFDTAQKVYAEFQEKYDALVWLRSTGAQYMGKHPPAIPGFFGGASHPVHLGVLTNINKPEKNLTGVTYYLTPEVYFNGFQSVFPDIKTVVYLGQKGHPSVDVDLKDLEEELKKRKLEFRPYLTSNRSELKQVTSLYQNQTHTLIIIGNQAHVIDNADAIAMTAGLTPIASLADGPVVNKHAMIGISASDHKLGVNLAESVQAVLMGKNIQNVPVKFDDNPQLIINLTKARESGLRLPDDYWRTEQMLSGLLRSVPVGIGTMENNKFTEVNPYVIQMLGYEQAELAGKNFDLLYGDDSIAQEVLNHSLDSLEYCCPKSIETRWQHKAGHWVDVLLSYTRLNPYSNDDASDVLFSVMDVTSQKQIEANIAVQRKNFLNILAFLLLLQTLMIVGLIIGRIKIKQSATSTKQKSLELEHYFNSSLDMLCIADLQGCFIRVNKTWEETLGYKSNHLAKQNILEFVHAEDKERTKRAFRNLEKQDPVATFTNRYLTSDGSYKLIEWRLQSYEKNIYAVAKDITHKAHAEQLEKLRSRIIEFGNSHELSEFLRRSLDEVEVFMESTISFYHFVDDDDSIFLQQWSSNTRHLFCHMQPEAEHYPIQQAGVWADCVRERKVIIHNDYAGLGTKQGLPSGHAPIIREMVVPVIRNHKVHAILGVGNKSGNYTQENANQLGFIADIIWMVAEKKIAEAALKTAEEKYRSLVDHSQSIIYTLDVDGIITYASPVVTEWLGFAVDYFIGKKIVDIVAHEDMAFVQDGWDAFKCNLKSGFTLDYRLYHANGDLHWHRSAWSAVTDEAGKLQYCVGNAIDLTTSKLMEQALQASEVRYRQLFDNMIAGFALHEMIYDNEGNPCDYRFLEFNKAFENQTGMQAKDFVGKTVLEALPGTESYWIQAYGEVAQSGVPKSFENYSKELGRYFEVWAFAPQKGQFAVVVVDATERKKAQNALLELNVKLKDSLDLYHDLVETSQDLIWQCDANGCYTYVNAAWQDVLGYDVQEMLGKPFTTFQTEEQAKKDQIVFSKLLAGDVVKGLESIHIHKSGQLIHLIFNAKSIFDANGCICGTRGTAYDITERIVAQQESEHQKNLMLTLLENMPIGAFMVEVPSGKPLLANETAKKLLGRGILPDANAENLSHVYQAFRNDSKQPYPVEEMPVIKGMQGLSSHIDDMRVVRPNGSYVVLEVMGTPVRDAAGKVVASLASFFDITERKQIEEQDKVQLELIRQSYLYEHKAFLQFAIDSISDLLQSPIAFFHGVNEDNGDIELQQWSTNTKQAFCRASVGSVHYKLENAGVWADCVRLRKPIIHNDYASLSNKKGLPKGHAHLIRELVVPVMRGNKIVAIMGVGNKPSDYVDEDVRVMMFFADLVWMLLERKQTQEALQSSQQKLSALFAAMTEMVVLHEVLFDDTGKPQNYLILDCNQAYCKIFNIEPTDAIGKKATEVYKVETAPYLELFSNVAITGESHTFETFFAPLNKVFLVSVVAPAKNQFATITVDITEQRRVNLALQRKNRDLENYLYIASHDLRAPLVNIQGFSNRLQKHTETISSFLKQHQELLVPQVEYVIKEKIPASLDFIFNNVSRMDRLINSLLEISRTGNRTLKIKQLDVHKIIQGILELYAEQLSYAQASINMQRLPSCFGDEHLITQMFTNLIGNAIKYKHPDKPLTLDISAKMEYTRCIYRIADNGIGIAEKYHTKVWDVFYRVLEDKTLQGDGIGLSIVKRIVEKHQGVVHMESEVGKGTVFLVELLTIPFNEEIS